MRIPLLAAIALIVIISASDYYIFRDITSHYSGKRKKPATIIFWISTAICWILAIAVLVMPKRDDNVSLLPPMWMLFTLLSIYIPKVLFCICSLIGRLLCRKARHNTGGYIGVALGLLVFVTMWWGALVTRYQIQVNHVDIVSAKLPQSFDGFKVVQFSDTHVGTWGNDTTFISALVDSINAQNPDLILFTGDYVNRRSDEFEPFANIFARLKATNGVYGVYGNHDYSSYMDWQNDSEKARDVFKMRTLVDSVSRIKMLNNSSEFISNGRDSIVLIGVENWGEPPFNQVGNLSASYAEDSTNKHGLNDGSFKLLMTHNPEHWKQVVRKTSNIDLTMSGHTHAMQIMLKIGEWKWSPGKYRYEHWAGLYDDKATDGTPMFLYVNIGAGEVGFPARIGAAKPELTVFTLHSK